MVDFSELNISLNLSSIQRLHLPDTGKDGAACYIYKYYWTLLLTFLGPVLQREALARVLLPLQQVQDQPGGQAVRVEG